MADNENLNDEVEVVVEDSDVITVPIDDTLTYSNEAADAKAVGDALALKADKSELQNAVTVNGQGADAQGAIIVTGADTKMSSSDQRTVKAAIEAVDSKDATDIPMSASDPTTVAGAIGATNESVTALGSRVTAVEGKTAADIPYQTGESIKQHIEGMEAGQVKTVYGEGPDADGDISPKSVPYAENLSSDETEETDDTFLSRTTGGHLGVTGNNAWVLRLLGNRVHTGYTPESLVMSVTPVPRTAPAAITAVLDAATFEAFVGSAGTYTLTYDEDDGWSADPADYGLTISNTPLDGDSITIVWDGENTPVMTVNAVPRTIPDPITATIDRDTFVGYVTVSGVTELEYDEGDWSAAPALYGVTVTGDPVDGDVITITYVKEVRGTITQANPSALISTGWNQYNHDEGYAKVVKYSNSYGWRIDGSYTALNFVTEPGETGTAITPDANGLFQVSGDGYVEVTDGDATTAIYPTWSDWGSGYVGEFQAYTESVVDIYTIMSGLFPYGLCQVGDIHDVIDFGTQKATSRIQRTSYSEANLAAIKATGRAYEYDENYIWFERSAPSVSDISIEAEYDCDDHGMEWFEDSEVGVYSEILYGQNLKDKLRRQVVTYGMTIGELQAMGT